MKKVKFLSLLLSSSMVLGLAGNLILNGELQFNSNIVVLAEEEEEEKENPQPNPDPAPNPDPDSQPQPDSDPEETTKEPVPETTVEETTAEETTKEETTAEETTKEETTVEETTKEETTAEETTVQEPPAIPVTPAPIPRPVYTQPPISNTPSDIIRVPTQPSTPQITTEETDPSAEEEEDIDLLKGHYIVFNWNIFTSEEEAQELIDIIEEDEEAENQLEYELEEISEGLYILRISYAEDADPKGKWVLFYIAVEFDTPEEAQEYVDYNLTIYPDIFFAGEVIQVGDKYDVIFGIRVKADTQALTYDEESFEVDYQTDREEFTYTVKADEETGEFIDPIPEAVEEAFPGKFTFTQEEISDTEIEVTMTPVETNDENTADEDTEIELDIQEETTADDSAE